MHRYLKDYLDLEVVEPAAAHACLWIDEFDSKKKKTLLEFWKMHAYQDEK